MLKSVQVARAIACMLVLFSHAAAVVMLPKYWGGSIFGGWLHIGRSGVDLFFVISGFIIFNVHHRDIGVTSELGRFVYNRFTRIYPYYWIYTGTLIALSGIGMFGPPRHFGPVAIVDFLSLLRISQDAPPLAVAWSLYYEVLFYVAFGILILRPRIGIAVMVGALVLVAFAAGYNTVNGTVPTDQPVWSNYALFLEFLGGYWAWRAQHWLSLSGAWKVLAVGVGALVVAVVIVDGLGLHDLWQYVQVLYGAAFSLIVAAVVAIERTRPFAVWPFAIKLGDASYSIYLAHFPTISLFAKVLRHVPVVEATPYLAFLLLSVISVAIGLIAHELCERPLMRLLRRHRTRASAVPA